MHYHREKVTPGMHALHKCWHTCRSTILTWGFWIGLTLGFPLEHFIWERIWPFNLITKLLGL